MRVAAAGEGKPKGAPVACCGRLAARGWRLASGPRTMDPGEGFRRPGLDCASMVAHPRRADGGTPMVLGRYLAGRATDRAAARRRVLRAGRRRRLGDGF